MINALDIYLGEVKHKKHEIRMASLRYEISAVYSLKFKWKTIFSSLRFHSLSLSLSDRPLFVFDRWNEIQKLFMNL